MAFWPCVSKPLPEPMLTNHQWGVVAFSESSIVLIHCWLCFSLSLRPAIITHTSLLHISPRLTCHRSTTAPPTSTTTTTTRTTTTSASSMAPWQLLAVPRCHTRHHASCLMAPRAGPRAHCVHISQWRMIGGSTQKDDGINNAHCLLLQLWVQLEYSFALCFGFLMSVSDLFWYNT